jgi:ABC-2 type transport system ATP-binding protein
LDQSPAVEAEGLSYSFGEIKALDGLTLRIERGRTYGLLGPNGAGKSTFIRVLVGLLRPQKGRVRVLGRPPGRGVSQDIGYMPQLSALYLELTAQENVDFFARLYGLARRGERRVRAEEALRLVGLWERRKDPVHRFSGGIRQRLSLACALAHRPRLLLLDEPTVGLDPELRVAFWEHFQALVGEGRSLVISSHTMDDAAHCQRLAFLRQGKVVGEGSPQELKAATGKEGATLEEAFLYFIHGGGGRVP